MLLDLTEGVQEGCALWNHLFSSSHLFKFQPTDEIIKIIGDLHRHLGIMNIERLLAAQTILCPLCSSQQECHSSGDEEGDDSMPLEMYQHMTVPKNIWNRHKEMKEMKVAHCRPLRKPMALNQLIPWEPRAFEILHKKQVQGLWQLHWWAFPGRSADVLMASWTGLPTSRLVCSTHSSFTLGAFQRLVVSPRAGVCTDITPS